MDHVNEVSSESPRIYIDVYSSMISHFTPRDTPIHVFGAPIVPMFARCSPRGAPPPSDFIHKHSRSPACLVGRLVHARFSSFAGASARQRELLHLRSRERLSLRFKHPRNHLRLVERVHISRPLRSCGLSFCSPENALFFFLLLGSLSEFHFPSKRSFGDDRFVSPPQSVFYSFL